MLLRGGRHSLGHIRCSQSHVSHSSLVTSTSSFLEAITTSLQSWQHRHLTQLGKEWKGASFSPLCHPLEETSPKFIPALSVCSPTKQAGGLSRILEVACLFPRNKSCSQSSLTKLHFEEPKTKVGILRPLCPKARWLIRQLADTCNGSCLSNIPEQSNMILLEL